MVAAAAQSLAGNSTPHLAVPSPFGWADGSTMLETAARTAIHTSAPVSTAREEPRGRTYEDIGAFAACLPERGALVGIDAGTKTLGLALSDITRLIASPLETIRRTKFTADAGRLLAIADRHKVAGFVLGLPANLDGSEGPRAGRPRLRAQPQPRERAAGAALGRAPVDGRGRTRLLEADASRRRRAEVIDKLAAALILQGALDRLRRVRGAPA